VSAESIFRSNLRSRSRVLSSSPNSDSCVARSGIREVRRFVLHVMNRAIYFEHQLGLPRAQDITEMFLLIATHVLFAAIWLVWLNAVNWPRQYVAARSRSRSWPWTARRRLSGNWLLASRRLLHGGPFAARLLLAGSFFVAHLSWSSFLFARLTGGRFFPADLFPADLFPVDLFPADLFSGGFLFAARFFLRRCLL